MGDQAKVLQDIAQKFTQQNPNIKVFAVEPEECDILAGGSWGAHKIEGIGDGFIPEVLHVEYLDGVVTTTSDEALEMARRLAREEGIFCGISSGCNVAAAIKVALRYPDIGLIVTVDEVEVGLDRVADSLPVVGGLLDGALAPADEFVGVAL